MPKLILVPTPIGNLDDITIRALETLRSADVILAEDTRKSGILLKNFEISKKLFSYHQHNEHKIVENILQYFSNYETIALITDAGTPGISDPGYLIVKACIDNEIEVECLPGPTAFVPALVMSGLPSDRFFFEGFLPHKKGRQSRLKFLCDLPYTFILYESPYRLLKTVRQLKEYSGSDRKIAIIKEISKVYETVIRGSIQDVELQLENATIKGEYVIVVQGNLI